ncbi:MAG: DNA topoisomerase (ATP-hydrolyzing) subunit B [Candidatus Stahlbacteria bacterium]|nr:DNA topoisomerase (ATP-hydrolyzing) subunit B [Candidatus Stahlbacteria bacterium]
MEEYKAKEIQVLEDIEAVRMRPAMYIGDTDKRGLHHLVFEVVDNSIDEAMVGFCNRIDVIIHKDESITVKDNGRGIPIDEHPIEKRPAVEVVMTTLHAGGKFNHKAYKVSGGLHGVGVSVVNALADWLEVEITREHKVYHQRYEIGKPVTSLKIINELSELDDGTTVSFHPDPQVFQQIRFSFDILSERIRELAFLNPGILLTILDERTEKKHEFTYKGGIVEFINFLNSDKTVLHPPIYFHQEKEGIDVEVALQYTDTYTENIFAYANSINTKEGGTHLAGFKSGITKAITSYAKEHNLTKEIEIVGDDTREGLTAVVAVKIADPQFEGQTKTKLGNPEAKGVVESLSTTYFSAYYEQNPTDAEKAIKKILSASKSRIAAQKARDLTRKKELFERSPLPGKLADCSEDNPDIAELYIVEGDSAGGSAKQGRDRKFQAILPIKGKILNVEKATEEKILSSEEIKAIMKAIGIGEENIRYKKIIIMTDADIDGSHIRTLLLTLFYRRAKELVESGYIYVAQPPLYKIKHKKKIIYAHLEADMNEKIKGLDPQPEIQLFKGLGEMNPDELFFTTMDPQTRLLKQITLEDAVEADKTFTILMGEKVEPRRQFIEENAKYVENLDV